MNELYYSSKMAGSNEQFFISITFIAGLYAGVLLDFCALQFSLMVEHLLSHDNYATESYLPCKKMMFLGSCIYIVVICSVVQKNPDLSSLPARFPMIIKQRYLCSD